jgi:hypothetical protein
MPNQQMRSGTVKFLDNGGDDDPHAVPKIDGHLWVPVDDEHTYVYNWSCAVSDAGFPEGYVERWESFMGRGKDDMIPGTYRLKRNKSNDYLIDRKQQRTETFSGIKGLNTQDYALQEGMGPIVDRSQEFLGTSDRAIVTMRRQLLEATRAVENGETPPATDPVVLRGIRPVDRVLDAGQAWKEAFATATQARW